MSVGAASLVLRAVLGLASVRAAPDLTELSLEELSEVEVTSVSRKAEPLSEAAAAVSVVTNEEIRRSGARTVPAALRLVPGLHVAQGSSSAWAVGSRGFSSGQSNKLLVLTDTRSIYTPLYSGVFWDAQDLLLEDVDRIEVIRGPGATLWGANAVNGVINITTKSAKKTQGVFAEAGGGTEERAFGSLRYGGRLGERLHYRFYARYFKRDDSLHPVGTSPDDWQMGHIGMRSDWEVTERDTVTFQAEAYRAQVGQLSPSVTIIGRPGPEGALRTGLGGGNALARWSHAFANGAEVQLRAYYDRTHRNDPTFLDDLDTIDVDFQNRLPLPFSQELTWGLAYRSMDNRNRGKGVFALEPPNSQDNLVSGFVQDQLRLPGAVRLTVGTKVEHNDFSGVEVQPSGRVAWDPADGHTVWGAVSRAVRVPTRLERDVAIDAGDPTAPVVPRLLGNRSFDAEELLAYELGYRWQWEQRFFADLALFSNRYHGLASLEQAAPFTDSNGKIIVPIVNRNLTNGESRGAEIEVTAQPVRPWRVTASYTNILVVLQPHGEDLNRGRLQAGATPRHQVGLQSLLDLPWGFQLDCRLRYLAALRSPSDGGLEGERIPGYAELDLRAAWRGLQGLELSLVGQNLLHAQHREFFKGAGVQRGVYLAATARF